MRKISKSLGTDTEGDSCFSINQKGGFRVCKSSFSFIRGISFSVTEAKQATVLKVSSGSGYPRIYHTCLMNKSERAKSAIHLFD